MLTWFYSHPMFMKRRMKMMINPVEFIESFMKNHIDEKAYTFIGHDNHDIRGIGIRKGKQTLHTLWNFIFQNET